MRHAFVDIGDKTMCSRCGNEVFSVDEECPAVSDGEIYKQANPPICHCDPVVVHYRGEKGCLHATDESVQRLNGL